MTTETMRAAIAEGTADCPTLAEPVDAPALMALLRRLYAVGRRDLPLGRLFEGHVDALQIVSRYGTPAQIAAAHADARGGTAFGVWNADLPGEALRLEARRLVGGKAFASGAGILGRALVTADAAGGRQLILVDLVRTPPAIDRDWWRTIGMQRSETHLVRWAGGDIDTADLIGRPGDYVREPWFSGGALRFAAVQAGGIAALLDHTRTHLIQTMRAADPHQAGRLAALYGIAQAAAGAVRAAGERWFDAPDDITRLAHVSAARVAVYAAGTQAIALAQEAVGLAGMFVDHPLAAATADLSVYLRQPGPDAQRMKVGAAVAAGLLDAAL